MRRRAARPGRRGAAAPEGPRRGAQAGLAGGSASRTFPPPSPDAEALADRLADLPLRVERVTAWTARVTVDGWETGARPAGFVRLEGERCAGTGESVAWTATDQARFAERCSASVTPGHGTVREWLTGVRAALPAAYDRAALEGAALDLALRQAGTDVFAFAAVPPAPVCFLHSFATLADPAAEVLRLLETSPRARVKLDVDPEWPDAVFDALARLDCVVVLDLKRRGGWRLARRVHAAVPGALLEDPVLEDLAGGCDGGSPGGLLEDLADGCDGGGPVPLLERLALDGPILSADDVSRLPLVPRVVNVKPARMGGFLEALRAVAACRALGIRTYVGGMFEVGPGRSQSQVLASLSSPGAWNDVAPLRRAADGPWPSSPLELPAGLEGLGFGAPPEPPA